MLRILLNGFLLTFGVLLLICLAVLLIPILAVVAFFYSLFGRKSLRGTFFQIRDSKFYRNFRKNASSDKGGTPPPRQDNTICDVECKVIRSEIVNDKTDAQ